MPMTIDGDGSITGLVAGGLPDNSITADEIADGVITRSKVSTSESDSFAFCRAWVNFNGTGTVAIRADFNVSSITDNGTGDYTINFTNAMPDVNYSATGISGDLILNLVISPKAYATSSFRLIASSASGGAITASSRLDQEYINVAIFR